LVKKYLTYINESEKPKFFNVSGFLSNYANPVIGEDELRKFVIGETCIFYIVGKSNMIRQKVGDVSIRGSRVYFNGYEIDQDYDVEIEENKKIKGTFRAIDKWEVIGFPSGEILTLNAEQIKKLMKANLVRYEEWIHWREMEFKDIYFFNDSNYHKIMSVIDPNYKKPQKNISKKNNYFINDIIVCKGIVGDVHVEDCVGKIIDMFKKIEEKEWSYLVSFMFKFSPKLIKLSDKDQYCWWIKRENIKGEYAGDIDNLLHLVKMQEEKQGRKEEPLEDYEIDDDYHIKQLFKVPGVSKIKTEKEDGKIIERDKVHVGDEIVIFNKKEALYNQKCQCFTDVYFNRGHPLGEVVDIIKINGIQAVKTDKMKNAYYKMECVRKK